MVSFKNKLVVIMTSLSSIFIASLLYEGIVLSGFQPSSLFPSHDQRYHFHPKRDKREKSPPLQSKTFPPHLVSKNKFPPPPRSPSLPPPPPPPPPPPRILRDKWEKSPSKKKREKSPPLVSKNRFPRSPSLPPPPPPPPPPPRILRDKWEKSPSKKKREKSPPLVSKNRFPRSPSLPPQPPPPPPPPPRIEYFMLVERWPNTYRITEKECRTDLPSKFVIHGLWPSRKGSIHDQPRDWGNKSKTTDLDFPYIKELQDEWPSLKPAKSRLAENTYFWGTQWKSHGTCSSMDAKDYFRLALDLHKRIGKNLKDVHKLKGKPVKRKDIFNAVRGDIGVKPEIKCIIGPHDLYYLQEIRICMDTSTDHNYIDCAKDYTDCPADDYVYFL